MKKFNQDGHVDFVFLEDFDKEKYAEYADLTASERKSLCAINLWRIKSGLHAIAVPENDYYYEHYFHTPEEVEGVNTAKEKVRAKAL